MIVGTGNHRYQAVPSWGAERNLGIASGVATDSQGRVYVVAREPTPAIVVYDRDDEAVKTAQAGGAEGASTLQQVVDALPAPRVVWVMVPSGDPTEESVMSLAELIEPGDTIIDGGNSN